MKIKKFQKIICLGLALLSIMVLPCYADNNIEYLIYGYSNNEQNINDGVSPTYINDSVVFNHLKEQGYFNNYNYINSFVFDQYYRYNYIVSNQETIYFIIIRPALVNITIYDGWDSNNIINYSNSYFIQGDNELIQARLYKIKLNKNNNYYDKYFQFYDSSLSTNLIADSIIFVSPVDEAVLNITTYTNLLIQNFAEAFTFMTGPALPWVLLGISVSLISFGVYSAKRFL